jgi:peptidoglycan-N-acetylglucosamine deacetylase
MAGAVGAAGVEEYRIHDQLATSGHAVGRFRPPGITSTTITYRVDTANPVIALTFDDGPSHHYTGQVLDILDGRDVSATFFLIGQHASRYPDLARRVAERHEIGNHTWSHPTLSLAEAPECRDQLTRAADAISSACGREPIVFRPPYGAFSGATVMIATGMGYPIVLWDYEFDQHGETATVNLVRLVRLARPGSIILGHDGGTLNCDVVVAVLPRLIDQLRDRGFRLVTMSELLATATPRPAGPDRRPYAADAQGVVAG